MACWLLAFWSLLTWIASAAGLEPGIDLLESLQLHNSTLDGVTVTPGPQRLRPAFNLQGDFRELKLPQTVYQRAVDLLRHNSEFTVAASLRQEESNSGTIVSFSHGNNRYLELQSSGRKDEIRLHYTSQHDSLVHVETFPYRLADNAWHKVALSISGSQVELLVDCHPLYRRLIRPPDRNFTVPQLNLWVGQRSTRHSIFKGALQEVRIISGPHGYLSQCPHLDSSCPTCGQFSLLQNTVEQLTRHLHDLSERLVAAEGRISRVEECDCKKSCRENGSVYADGATWQKDCQICSCVHGEIQCRPVQCPPAECRHPVKNPGECCETCLKQCFLRGEMYDHGESVNLRECVECECLNGVMQCKRIDPETMCPELKCDPQDQFSVPGNCCRFCKDVDECQQEGGLEGHHCHSNTRCVNTNGSYICECLPGYRRYDKFNCVELDECSTGEHACHEHADCVNTLGSYHCKCQQGYEGDGYNCKPICNQTCLNGGECLSPGNCTCRKGYEGPSCELDLDECSTNLHRCHKNSMCVNMPGWYYCRCKPGYRSILHDSTLGTICQDIDECQEGTHSCHPSARCVNIEGGFECTCPKDRGPDCKLSCMFEGVELANGLTNSPAGNPCRRCKCTDGVISCKDPECDCSVSTSDKCCPQCDPSQACRHQELNHVIFRSGERWIYQCQTCECLYGEIDCWAMECPPLTCKEPILSQGDCCPRCEDDPCGLDSNSNTSVTGGGKPCTYLGHLYESGSQWKDPYDKCTACNCKDGHLCCNYDFHCSTSAEQPVGIATNGTATAFSGNTARGNVSKVGTPQAQIRETNTSAPNDSLARTNISGGSKDSESVGGLSEATTRSDDIQTLSLFVSSNATVNKTFVKLNNEQNGGIATTVTEGLYTSQNSSIPKIAVSNHSNETEESGVNGNQNNNNDKNGQKTNLQKRETIMKQISSYIFLTEEQRKVSQEGEEEEEIALRGQGKTEE